MKAERGRSHLPACGALLVLGVLAAAASADSAEAPSPSASGGIEQPATEATATFRDWHLICDERCRIEAAVAGADGRPVLRFVVEEVGGILRVETPLPLLLPPGVALAIGSREPHRLHWHTCGAGGCEAHLPLDPATVATLRGERAAAVDFTLLDASRVRLQVSLMGFSAAEAALREHAAAADAAPAGAEQGADSAPR